MTTPRAAVHACVPSLLLLFGGACGSPGTVGADGEPSESEPKPGHPEPPLLPALVVDPEQPEAREPLPALPVYRCQDAGTTPLRCGLAAACKELAERWVEQLDVGASAEAHVAGLTYPEDPCPDPALSVHDGGFACNAVILEHRLEVLAEDAVAELWTLTAEGWRGEARITEVAATGMASQRRHRPVASWQRDLDRDGEDELVVLIRGRDSGHAAKADPFTRAYVVICDDREPGCGRLLLGEWLEGTHEDHATPAQREAVWSGVLRIHPERRSTLVLAADDDRHDLATRFDELPSADAPLIPR